MATSTALLLPPYLPPTTSPPSANEQLEADDAAACAASTLEDLLAADTRRFSAAAGLGDGALGTFIDTYLRFAPRQLAFDPRRDDGVDNETPLRAQVLRVLLRLAMPPATPTAEWSSQVSAWFSVPRLLDIYALYGFSDAASCERINDAVLRASPKTTRAQMAAAIGAAATAILHAVGYSAEEEDNTPSTLQLPRVTDLSKPEDVDELATWLNDACGTLHALGAVAPVGLLREGDEAGGAPLLTLTGPSGVLTALQITAEAALPRLRQAAAAANSTPAVHDALAAAGIHCAHGASLIALKALVDVPPGLSGVGGGRGGGKGGGGKGGGGKGGKGGGKGKGGGGKGGGGKGGKGGDSSDGDGGRVLDSEELTGALLQLADPCEMLAGCEALYEKLNVPVPPAAGRLAPQRLVRGGGALLQQMLRFTSFGESIDSAAGSLPADSADVIRQLLASARDEAAARRALKHAGGGAGGAVVTAEERHMARTIGEMLPGMGEGFLVAVIRHYGGRTEPAINAMLEGTLPSHLEELSRDLKTPPVFGAHAAAAGGSGVASGGHDGGGESPRGGGGRRTDTVGKRRALKEERSVLGDTNAAGRRAPKAVLEAASTDVSMLGADGGYAPPAVVSGASLGLYDDEFDDSLEAFSAEARMTGPALKEDLEEDSFAVRRGGQGTGAGFGAAGLMRAGDAPGGMGGGGMGGSSAGGGAANGLPANALEWVRAIGLGQYAEKMQRAGIIRLELAAAIGDTECARLQTTPAHKTKLLASAARLATRLKERGRALPGAGAAAGEVYASAAQLHYDAETGTFWDEGGLGNDSGGGGGGGNGSEGAGRGQAGGGSAAGARPPNPALQRRRAEANKAKVGNHNRKQGADRKQQKAGGFGA